MTPRLPSTSCWSVQTNFIFIYCSAITTLRPGSFHVHDYEFALCTIPRFAALLLLVDHLTKFLLVVVPTTRQTNPTIEKLNHPWLVTPYFQLR